MLNKFRKRMKRVDERHIPHIIFGATFLPMLSINWIAATLFFAAFYGAVYLKFERWPIQKNNTFYDFSRQLITATLSGLFFTACYMSLNSLLMCNPLQLAVVFAISVAGSYVGYKMGPNLRKCFFPGLHQLDESDKERIKQSETLIEAIYSLDEKGVECLIKEGADVKRRSILNAAVRNALHHEQQLAQDSFIIGYDPRQDNLDRSLKIIQLLVNGGADVNNASPITGNTFLHNAISRHSSDVATLLIKLGADFSQKNKKGILAIDRSSLGEHSSIRRAIIERCEKVKANHRKISSLKNLSLKALHGYLEGKETYHDKPLQAILPPELIEGYYLTAARENKIGNLSIIDFCKNHLTLTREEERRITI